MARDQRRVNLTRRDSAGERAELDRLTERSDALGAARLVLVQIGELLEQLPADLRTPFTDPLATTYGATFFERRVIARRIAELTGATDA